MKLINLLNNSCRLPLTAYLIIVPAVCAGILCKGANKIDLFSIGSIIVLFVTIVNLCYFGQRIEDEVSNLYAATLEIKWFDMDIKLIRSYRMILMMFEDQMAWKAEPKVIFNYNYLVGILQLIYSYAMFLQKMQKNND